MKTEKIAAKVNRVTTRWFEKCSSEHDGDVALELYSDECRLYLNELDDMLMCFVGIELAALKKENAELKKQREIAENRLGDFLDEYNQSLYHGTKRLAQAILNVVQRHYQNVVCGKVYEGTIKELNQYLVEENTQTVAELESIAKAILGLKDSVGPVPPSMYHRS